ncbi:heme-dependent oxidative N-demethylase family protein [Noviherbaspirillum aerium]|uniref:heme-dependent oxidative N-demethylase family protein n=1 Tax=Noviherbaspirillum aerium TaxID=2588497 RepID=UPI00124E9179|nr:DUF3445 domain-containing protein [Noviherbaspirillum aerium]
MTLHGVYPDRLPVSTELIESLRNDDMERFRAVPHTVMINAWQPGLQWLLLDRTYPAQIRLRHHLLGQRLRHVIDRLPGDTVRQAELELRDEVVAYLLDTYPGYFQRDGDLVLSPLTGLAIDVSPRGADPLVAVALLASEDMLLLLPAQREANAGYILQSGALLFPNGWSLRSQFDKPEPQGDAAASADWHAQRQRSQRAARLGKSPREIHDGHVRHYMEQFAARVDRFFARMEPGMRTWRRNWGMKPDGELFLHPDVITGPARVMDADGWAAHGYLRSEQETFAKLPRSGAIVFGIKTYLWKLSDLVSNPVALNALLAASDQLAPAMAEYRAEGLPAFRQFLERHRPLNG